MATALPPRARALAVRVASGQSVRAAAKAIGLGESQAYTYSGQKAFKSYVAELQRQVISQALGMLNRGAKKAAAALVALLKDTDPRVRLQAASRILELYTGLDEHFSLHERLAQLENIGNAKGRGTHR